VSATRTSTPAAERTTPLTEEFQISSPCYSAHLPRAETSEPSDCVCGRDLDAAGARPAHPQLHYRSCALVALSRIDALALHLRAARR